VGGADVNTSFVDPDIGTSFVDPGFLADIGPAAFTRQVERLLLHLGFSGVVNIDGPNDQGGDILASIRGQRWVFQAKWKASASVPASAIDEVLQARIFYKADKAVVVTNSRFGPSVFNRREELRRAGTQVELWSGRELVELYGNERATAARLPERPLRPYQSAAFQGLVESLDDTGKALLILATGLGKTVIGGEVIARFLRHRSNDRVLVVAHTKELAEQLERALWYHVGKNVRTQLLTGDHKPNDLRGITCATVASALAYVRGGYRPGLVMVDEAHHVAENGQFTELLDLLSETPQFGVTATPWRGDRFDIRRRFGEPSYKLGIEDGMRLGYLAEVRYRLFADNIDWDFVREASHYQYTIRDLNARLFLPERDEAIRDELVETWARTREPRAVVFCRTVEHAERMANLLNRVPQWKGAEAVHAGLRRRDRQLRLMRFRAGDTPIITAVDILNEGVDVPDVNIICFARVTHSRRIFVQQLGRGLRLRDGKSHVEALDFVSDIRRVAAIMNLREQVGVDEVETLRLSHKGTRFEFTDRRAETLMQEWIKDAADLETALDEAKLQFPDPDLLGG
jgi:superfamily II DNA or RNA helicase